MMALQLCASAFWTFALILIPLTQVTTCIFSSDASIL